MGSKTEVVIDGNATGFRRAMQEVVASARDGRNGIESQFGSLSTVFSGVKNHIAAIGAAFAGIGVAGFIRQSIDAADNLNDLSQRMGVSVETLAGLKLAADQSGASLEGVAKASKTLSANMGLAVYGNKEMSSLLDSLGISGMNTTDAMVKMADVFKDMPDGWLKSATASKLFGKAGEEMIPVLNGGSAALLKQIELGAKFSGVTGEMGHQADQFNDDLAVLKLTLGGMWTTIGRDLLPVMNSLMGDLQKAAEKTRVAHDEFSPLKETLRALIVVGGNVAFVFNGIGREIGGIAAQMGALATGNFSGFSAIGKAMKADAVAARKEFDEWEKRMMSPNFGITPAAPPSGGGAGGGAEESVCRAMGGRWNAKTRKCESGATTAAAKSGAPDTQMQYYEATLDQEKRVAAERDALRGYSKQEELAFWQMLLANADLTGKDRVAIERKVSGLIVDIKRTEAKQRQELDGEAIRSNEALEIGKIESAQTSAQAALELGMMTKAQFLEMEQQHEIQRFEIQRTALEQRLKLLEKDPNTNPVEFARIKNQILEMEQQHNIKRIQISGKIAQESGQIWKDLGDRMGGLWDKGVQAMMNGTLTWRSAMRAAGAEVVGWFARDVVGKQVRLWIMGEAAKTGATQTGVAVRGAAEAAASLKSIGLWAMTAAKNIMTAAWEAMAAAWKAVVGIPVIGPVLAPIAAGAAFAGVSALAKNVMSAEGGYDIPRGINPLTQLHEEEMVLPKAQAKVIRDMADGGGPAAGRSGATVNVHVTAMDSQSVIRALTKGGALQKTLRELGRNFTPVKAS